MVLWQNGDREGAERAFSGAARTKPDDPQLMEALGKSHLQIERFPEAVAFLRQASDLQPDNINLSLTLALAWEKAGDERAALGHYEKILQDRPTSLEARNNLAMLLATCSDPSLRDGQRALALATEVNGQTKGTNPASLHTLAAAQAENDDLPAAIKTLDKAIAIARATGQGPLVTKLRERRQTYLVARE